MPTYEYKCDACGVEFERFQSMTAAPVKSCPACGKSRVRRLISCGAGLIFKGSGFYITDYRSDGYKKAAQSESSSSGTASPSSPSGDGNGAVAKAGSKAEKKSSGKVAAK